MSEEIKPIIAEVIFKRKKHQALIISGEEIEVVEDVWGVLYTRHLSLKYGDDEQVIMYNLYGIPLRKMDAKLVSEVKENDILG